MPVSVMNEHVYVCVGVNGCGCGSIWALLNHSNILPLFGVTRLVTEVTQPGSQQEKQIITVL